MIAADGLLSARYEFVGDHPFSSGYVRSRHNADRLRARRGIDVYLSGLVGPERHFVHYALRGGELLNQVAVFEPPKALARAED